MKCYTPNSVILMECLIPKMTPTILTKVRRNPLFFLCHVLTCSLSDPGKQILLKQYGQAFEQLHRTSKKYLDQCSYRFIDIGAYSGAYDVCE